MRYLTRVGLALGLVLTTSRLEADPNGPRYTITDLGPAAPGGATEAAAINDLGHAAGLSQTPGGTGMMTLWLAEPAYGLPAGVHTLGDLEIPGSRGYGINDAGLVVGFGYTADGSFEAALWDPAAGMTGLGSLGGTHSIARAVNGDGLVVGESDSTSSGVFRTAFLWDGERMLDLGSFEEGSFESRAADINEQGQIVGHAMYLDNPEEPDNSRLRAALWLSEPAYGLPAGINDLDDLSLDDRQISLAKGINDLGQVVVWGSNELPNGTFYTSFWLWLPEPDFGLPAGMNDLRGPNGMDSTAFAHDVNDRGEAVLRANIDPSNPFGVWSAMLWRQGEWFDLHTCIPPEAQAEWYFGSATDINDDGQIVGWGYRNGEGRGFLLTPILDDACRGDLNGDGTVGFEDLVTLLAAWGTTDETADLDGSGLVDFADLVLLLSAWGPCSTEPGACCFAVTGDCQPLDEAGCSFMGGTWFEAEACATFACAPAVTGSCCFVPDGSCTEVSEFHCDLAGGTWWGAGTTCAITPCPQMPQGDWIGNPFIVPTLPYSSSGNSGTFHNFYDEQCDWHAIAPDVVYEYTPKYDEIVNISLCEGSGYDTKLFVYEGVEGNTLACNDDACTTPSFPSQPYVSRIESLPLTGGETYYIIVDGWGSGAGFYTIDIDSVEPGACCLPSNECSDISIDLCLAIPDAEWFEGETCETFVCPELPRGACCLPGGSCVANQTEWDCVELFGGVWQGEGTSCLTTECP